MQAVGMETLCKTTGTDESAGALLPRKMQNNALFLR